MNRIRKGDSVIVISGKEKNKDGIVLEVFPKKGTAIVEGINKVAKHQKQDSTHESSGIIVKEAPIRLCKLALIEVKGKHKGLRTKIKFVINKETNQKVRISKQTNTEIGAK
mgnify:CR=1 FL=1